jgi:hypothetical protein
MVTLQLLISGKLTWQFVGQLAIEYAVVGDAFSVTKPPVNGALQLFVVTLEQVMPGGVLLTTPAPSIETVSCLAVDTLVE